MVAPLWPQEDWFADLLSLLVDELLELPQVRNLLAQPHVRKFHRGLKTLHHHSWRLSSVSSERQAFLGRLLESQHRTSSAPLQPFTNLKGPGSMVVVIGLSFLAVKGYRSALNHVFLLTGMDLAASSMVSWMFLSFKRSCPLWEILPLDWNLSLVLRCLSRPPFEPLKLASDKYLTGKTSFLHALVSAKMASELHGFSVKVHHSQGRKSCTFSFLPYFMAKTQNLSVLNSHFKKFFVLSLDDFIGSDRDELLPSHLCPPEIPVLDRVVPSRD